METYEREFVEAVAENLGASIANGMRDAEDRDLLADERRLTEAGQQWVHGYLTGRLAMLRSGATGNPNLTVDDVEQVATIADRKEGDIAAQLYA